MVILRNKLPHKISLFWTRFAIWSWAVALTLFVIALHFYCQHHHIIYFFFRIFFFLFCFLSFCVQPCNGYILVVWRSPGRGANKRTTTNRGRTHDHEYVFIYRLNTFHMARHTHRHNNIYMPFSHMINSPEMKQMHLMLTSYYILFINLNFLLFFFHAFFKCFTKPLLIITEIVLMCVLLIYYVFFLHFNFFYLI